MLRDAGVAWPGPDPGSAPQHDEVFVCKVESVILRRAAGPSRRIGPNTPTLAHMCQFIAPRISFPSIDIRDRFARSGWEGSSWLGQCRLLGLRHGWSDERTKPCHPENRAAGRLHFSPAMLRPVLRDPGRRSNGKALALFPRLAALSRAYASSQFHGLPPAMCRWRGPDQRMRRDAWVPDKSPERPFACLTRAAGNFPG